MMAVNCLKCGYRMSTGQELTSTMTHVAVGAPSFFGNLIKTLYEVFKSQRMGVLAGPMNHEIGSSKGVKCPNCGSYGKWEDAALFDKRKMRARATRHHSDSNGV